MADTFVTRVTGQATADAVPVEVQLVMTDRALFAGDTAPAQLPGYGTVPAAVGPRPAHPSRAASQSADDPPDHQKRVWLRRLYTHPDTGALVGMDSTRRTFDGGLRRYLLTRDAGTCRTPWCDAPARHLDHIHDHAQGGPTTAGNGQGLCVRCNHTKQLPGFTATTLTDPGDQTRQPGAPHTVHLTTPTGHTYTSHAPPLLPGLTPTPPGDPAHAPPGQLSPLERVLTLALAA